MNAADIIARARTTPLPQTAAMQRVHDVEANALERRQTRAIEALRAKFGSRPTDEFLKEQLAVRLSMEHIRQWDELRERQTKEVLELWRAQGRGDRP